MVVVDGGEVVGVMAVHSVPLVDGVLELEDVLIESVRYDLAVLLI